MYVPTPGITCFQDSACAIPAASDDPVGGMKDYLGLYPATQATSGYRPILRGKVKNYAKYSSDVSNALWQKIVGASATDSETISCPTTNNSGLLSEFTASGITGLAPFIGTFCVSFEIKGTLSAVRFYVDQADSVISSAPNSVITLTSTYTKYSFSINVTTAGTVWRNYFFNQTGTAGTFSVKNFQIEIGSIANPVIPTTSAAASSSYGQYWLDFDGVNDVLSISGLSAFTSAAVIKSVKNTGYSIQTEQDISAGYSFNTALSNALMLAKSTPSSSELAVIKKYFDRLAGVA